VTLSTYRRYTNNCIYLSIYLSMMMTVITHPPTTQTCTVDINSHCPAVVT